ncbi:hypothetical protein [Fusobacterium gastrosuis]|nr:hypothetical protein [Fusobacteriaceae bacterium]MDY5305397.1 hypothetical protein [Fusobacterium gastrosuis]MDY5713857.1 hypothetical protein [Fusobacterium gastrosuis]
MSKATSYLIKKKIRKLDRKIKILETTIVLLLSGIFGYIFTVNVF